MKTHFPFRVAFQFAQSAPAAALEVKLAQFRLLLGFYVRYFNFLSRLLDNFIY